MWCGCVWCTHALCVLCAGVCCVWGVCCVGVVTVHSCPCHVMSLGARPPPPAPWGLWETGRGGEVRLSRVRTRGQGLLCDRLEPRHLVGCRWGLDETSPLALRPPVTTLFLPSFCTDRSKTRLLSGRRHWRRRSGCVRVGGGAPARPSQGLPFSLPPGGSLVASPGAASELRAGVQGAAGIAGAGGAVQTQLPAECVPSSRALPPC